MLYDYQAGDSPLLVDVPHAGTALPDAVAARLTPVASKLPDTDWHVDRLAAPATGQGAGLLVARQSRYLIDLNRGRDDKPLYSGATTGLVPTENFDGSPVYSGSGPDRAEEAERIERYWQPYHDCLASAVEAIRERHGHAVLLDVHSIKSRVPRLFDGRLPDLNLGTFDGRSCAGDLQAGLEHMLAQAPGFSSVANGRFKGGFITRHYGRPDAGIHAVQLEIAQACYMDEHHPDRWDAARARPLMRWLEAVMHFLVEWRPA